jgi:hypothetical protein
MAAAGFFLLFAIGKIWNGFFKEQGTECCESARVIIYEEHNDGLLLCITWSTCRYQLRQIAQYVFYGIRGFF